MLKPLTWIVASTYDTYNNSQRAGLLILTANLSAIDWWRVKNRASGRSRAEKVPSTMQKPREMRLTVKKKIADALH
jgi:hypothetical protein